MKWFKFMVDDTCDFEDLWSKTDCILYELDEEVPDWSWNEDHDGMYKVHCTKETLMKIFDRVYDDEYKPKGW